MMSKRIVILFLAGIFFTACSELPQYELPYDLSAVSNVDLNVSATPQNAFCDGPVATFTTDSPETTVYFVLAHAAVEFTSQEIFDEGDAVYIADAGSKAISLGILDLGSEYHLYAVTVNKDGTRSDVVSETSFSAPSPEDILSASLSATYSGEVSLSGSVYASFTTTLTDNGDGTYDADTLWGDFVANATGSSDYAGLYQYPATITIADDFSVVVEDTEAVTPGGVGTYDPCTNSFSLTLEQFLFTEDDGSSSFTVDVTLVPIAE